MTAQDLIYGSRVAHIRELTTELAALKAENAHLRDELAAVKAHVDWALLAAEELRNLPKDARAEIWDGWNLILGARKEAQDRAELIAGAQAAIAAAGEGKLRIWIVFDGPNESVAFPCAGLRVSYTGGAGAQRADRMIIDFVRMAAYARLTAHLSVRTNDKDFARQVNRLLKTP